MAFKKSSRPSERPKRQFLGIKVSSVRCVCAFIIITFFNWLGRIQDKRKPLYRMIFSRCPTNGRGFQTGEPFSLMLSSFSKWSYTLLQVLGAYLLELMVFNYVPKTPYATLSLSRLLFCRLLDSRYCSLTLNLLPKHLFKMYLYWCMFDRHGFQIIMYVAFLQNNFSYALELKKALFHALVVKDSSSIFLACR